MPPIKKFYIIFKNGVKFFIRAHIWELSGSNYVFTRYILALTACATTNASNSVACASTTSLAVGHKVTGDNIPAGTTVSAITDATHFTMSANASATASGKTFLISNPAVSADGGTFVKDSEVGAIGLDGVDSSNLEYIG